MVLGKRKHILVELTLHISSGVPQVLRLLKEAFGFRNAENKGFDRDQYMNG